ncbi:MAG: deoxyribodipyrimidine photolyase [Desulfuromonadaceae bacterium]|nr:deoxyribodipyrimidine photolyase [Desulfuromonadaceae bacterium]
MRLTTANHAPIHPAGDYVLYWMHSARRPGYNFALQQAAAMACQLQVGLVVFEPLVCDEPYASLRFHHFVLQGMRDNQQAFATMPILYYPWLETKAGEWNDLLSRLAHKACLVITDRFPTTPVDSRVKTVANSLPVQLQTVDSNGLLPLQLVERDYPTAYAFRRFLQKVLPAFLNQHPLADPLQGLTLPQPKLPAELLRRYPIADPHALLRPGALDALPIDHRIKPVGVEGGAKAAGERLLDFLCDDLAGYDLQRNQPDSDRTSRLAPYLHFGHLSVHEIFSRLAEAEGWHAGRLALETSGRRSGWWGMSSTAEAFLDELVTWRELAYAFCARTPDYSSYESLPTWAQHSLNHHADDLRPVLYSPAQFEEAATHDPLWNAAQRQLREDGRIHGYLRMLWGKKILEWSLTPQLALNTMLDLNDRYALDGRNPNSYSGIGWCLGRFDRAWGPEREIFGKIRYMSSENTARKVSVKKYLQRYSGQKSLF